MAATGLNKTEQVIGTVISIFAMVLLLLYMVVSRIGFDNELKLLQAIALLFVVTTAIAVIIFTRYTRQKKADKIDYLNIGTQRYILGIFMIFYGLPKLLGNFFDYQLFAMDSRLADISEFELAWYYFGKNRWQELFAGLMELLPGLLLLNRRTYYIAALALLPVTGQVFLLNLFFKIGGITFQAAAILLACNLYILYSQKKNIIHFFRSIQVLPVVQQGKAMSVIIKISKGIAFFLVAFIIINQLRPVFAKPGSRAKYSRLVGAYQLTRLMKNNRPYTPVTDSLYYKDIYIEKQSRWNILRRYNDKTDAFLLQLNDKNDSLSLYINKGGIGDGKDIPDSATVLKGVYFLEKDVLKIKGIQIKDTLELTYRKQALKPKEWFW